MNTINVYLLNVNYKTFYKCIIENCYQNQVLKKSVHK